MNRHSHLIVALLLVISSACADRAPDNPDLVARAADLELTVQEGADILAPATSLPNRTSVATAMADLWVDYALLATAMAEDTTLRQLDMEPLIRQQAEQAMIVALRDSVVDVDTSFDATELQQRYQAEAPGSEIRARQILRTIPEGATEAQVDSVRAFLAEVRREIVEQGEDFASLAARFSQDPATASQGGEIGFFGPGDMHADFRSAAESLEVGEISQPVRTPFGYHLIQVTDRQTPSLEDFRGRLMRDRVLEAESEYMADLIDAAEGEYADNAYDIVRQLASNPSGLEPDSENDPLITYRGGQLTVGEVREFLQSRPPQYRAQVAVASDALIREQLFRPLYQRELLVSEARAQGWDVAAESVQDIPGAARATIRSAARELGLAAIEPASGETMDEAIEQAVTTLVAEMIRGEREVVPLGAIGVILRGHYGDRISSDGITRLVARVADMRTAPGGP